MNRAQVLAHAHASIRRGSKSFRAASRLFDRQTRERVWLLYAWCRACDDLADAQDHGGEPAQNLAGGQSGAHERLETIRSLTALAFDGAETGNPAFDALGLLARETGVTRAMAEDVIAGFVLDTAGWRPASEADSLRYCYHVAGAVGVMMAVVMGVSPQDEDTLGRACDLGLGFQLANIVRDVAEDTRAGRCYLPGDWLVQQGIAPAHLLDPAHRPALAAMVHRLTRLQRAYDASARIGAARLSFRSRWAVLSAAAIYGAIARKVEAGGEAVFERRVTTSKAEKLGFVLCALLRSIAMQVMPPQGARSRPLLSRQELAAMAAEEGHAARHAAR